jgi:aminoglycoside phosphotransferase (APT) family kinase protein
MIAGVDDAAFDAWLAEHVPQVSRPVKAELLAGGRSNLTYRLTDADGTRFALRRPPVSDVLESAHDMSREWAYLTALADGSVPVARPLAYCADRSVCSDDFYVMEYVDGVVLDDRGSAEPFDDATRGAIGADMVRVLTELHRVDPYERGLAVRPRGEGYIERQLRRWSTQVDAVDAPEAELLRRGHDLLRTSIPVQETGIVHGDFRLGNMSLGPDGSVLAVFDWELATVGDVLADIGWMVATWAEPGDDFIPDFAGPSGDGGFWTRTQLGEAYAAASGRSVEALDYYVAFARWRMCCISVGVRHRYLSGAMGDDGYDARGVDQLLQVWGEMVVESLR